ncbi:amidohydrolase [Lasiosphaeria hispida]|uniref:Amidohydrolase n=1 Tax=Lasiosphaeria hispida TaxID=260671 RepID=A0AAJ0MIQ5_9PEZI|nr:amidohydrolase [Lasiosphaeria hispida]
MRLRNLPILLAALGWAAGSSILFRGGTIIAFDKGTESLQVIRNGSVLVTDDRIVSVSGSAPRNIPAQTEVIDIAGKILAPGQVNTHLHGWQTAFKTLASNTSLVEYFSRYGEFAAAGLLTPEDVYIGELAGLFESLNGGVTTILDHAHHTWSNATAQAGLVASIDSGARVFWAYAFHNITTITPNFLVPEQLGNFRDLVKNAPLKGSPTEVGVAYDAFGPNPNVGEVNAIISLAKELNASVITTHSLQGAWGIDNSPENLNTLGILNISIPIVLSHASFLTATGAQLLRSTNQYISITPESEFHYGHTHPHSHLIQDQSSLGVDTHFTFSSDILTQTRLWLQSVRRRLYSEVLGRWEVPDNNPMSVNQAFLLATRHGGLALRRDDLGVIAPGAKADLVVWDAASSPAMLGWNDPVAAVVLHASVADVEAVLVDGRWKKRGGRLVGGVKIDYYGDVQKRFLASAKRIQNKLIETPSVFPRAGDVWAPSGFPVADALTVDTLRGPGDGYGETFLAAQ